MPRNIELVQGQFGSENSLPSIELADNALKLGGIAANLYALKSDLNGEVSILLGNIQDVIDELTRHENDDVRHLTQGQIDKINAAINAAQALEIANQAINSAKDAIIASAVTTADAHSKDYTDTEVGNLNRTLSGNIDLLAGRVTAVETGKQDTLTFDSTPTQNSTNPVTSGGIYAAMQNGSNVSVEPYTDPISGSTTNQALDTALRSNPQTRINPEYFYRFKNMIENSSLEVFNGVTLLPLGWDAGEVTADAAVFGTYSLKLEPNVTAKQTSKFQASRSWMIPNTYNTNDCILCFYHKHNAIGVKIYDVNNSDYLTLTKVDSDLVEDTTHSGTEIVFPEINNWGENRCMVKFTPPSTADKLRIEFVGKSGTNTAGYVDALMMEPFVSGEYPSIYKDGRYSVSAYQILNPPPSDVDRWTDIGHFSTGNALYDARGNIYYQELLRPEDNSLAIKREASNDDANGYYQTIVETFYKADGTVNYVDTWSYTYTSTGAILTASKTTTET